MGDMAKTLPPGDPLTAFKAEIRGMVEGITAKTLKQGKAELLARLT